MKIKGTTVQNAGDNVVANTTNSLSWKVSEDWATRLGLSPNGVRQYAYKLEE